MPFVSHCLMQLQQGIIFRSVQFSALPPKIVSAPVVLFQSTWDSWSYHQPNSHNYQRHFPHDFNQETSTKVNQVVQLLWYLCVFDTDKIFVTGLHLQVRIPQHCIWPTVFHNKNFNNVDFTMSKHSPSIHRYPPTLNLRWQFCHPIHCPGWADSVHQGRCSQQILEKSPPPCMVLSGSKTYVQQHTPYLLPQWVHPVQISNRWCNSCEHLLYKSENKCKYCFLLPQIYIQWYRCNYDKTGNLVFCEYWGIDG